MASLLSPLLLWPRTASIITTYFSPRREAQPPCFCRNPSQSERVVTDPGPYPAVIFFVCVWNVWNQQFQAEAVSLRHAGFITMVTACLPRLHPWRSVHPLKDHQKASAIQ